MKCNKGKHNRRDLWKSYTRRSFLPNHKIRVRPTKRPILLPMTSVVVVFLKYQGGFCAQAGCVAPCVGGVPFSPSWHSALLRDSRGRWPRGLTERVAAGAEPWHLSPRRRGSE